MFEIGKWYTVYTVENGGEVHGSYRVVDFQSPLLKLHSPYSQDLIINTHSGIFSRAELSADQDELNEDAAIEEGKNFA